MKRSAYNELLKWKNKPSRKPLIIRGARQVGKTWLMKEFAKTYETAAYINLEGPHEIKNSIQEGFDIDRILDSIKLSTGVKIQPNTSLLIFDEIQEAPGALTMLKYFDEHAPDIHIVCAGSLLGIALGSQQSFPVGKVDFLTLYPLNFIEFLEALNEQNFIELLQNQNWDLIRAFNSKYKDLLRTYYYTGGMPEVVDAFAKRRDYEEVREIQNRILQSYEQDFGKHAPANIQPRIKMVWDSILSQLAKENRKFIYRLLREGARAKEFELALQWLEDMGLVYKITRVTKPGLPLKAYEDLHSFKLYLFDVGLLAAMGKLSKHTLLHGSEIFTEFKGALSEQYVLQQLTGMKDIDIHYWTPEQGIAELDFLVQLNATVIPIEVKAEENRKAKSMRRFMELYSPNKTVLASMADYRNEPPLTRIPLYAISTIDQYNFRDL